MRARRKIRTKPKPSFVGSTLKVGRKRLVESPYNPSRTTMALLSDSLKGSTSNDERIASKEIEELLGRTKPKHLGEGLTRYEPNVEH